MHAAAVAAALPPPQPQVADPSPAMFGLFSPGATAARCLGMLAWLLLTPLLSVASWQVYELAC